MKRFRGFKGFRGEGIASLTAPSALRVLKFDGAFAPKVLRFDGPLARRLWYRPWSHCVAGFRGFRRFRGEGIAYGDEYEVSVTG